MNLPKRKSPRLKAYDYSTPGYYFVTICTRNKQKMFGEVVTQKACNPTVGAIHESPEKEICIMSRVAKDSYVLLGTLSIAKGKRIERSFGFSLFFSSIYLCKCK